LGNALPYSAPASAARCIRNPELTSPGTAISCERRPQALITEQVRAPRFSRYQPSVFWSPVLWLGRWRLTRIELAFPGCKPDALPLSYSPVSCRRDLGRGAATVNRTRIASLARSCSAIELWPRRAPVRNRTGTCRLRNGCSTLELQGHRASSAACAREAWLQRKDSNLHLSH
jgi:hypothetical protein